MSSHVNTCTIAIHDSPLRSAVLVILSSGLIGLFANVAIPLPFTPIPFATQAQVILCLAVLLGSKRAFMATAGFLFQGIVGLPVFAGGIGGVGRLLGPAGGYLLGYLAAAFLAGYLSERMKHKTPLKLFLVMAAGNGIVFLFGVPFLATFIGCKQAFVLGLLPFLPGDFVKLCIGVKILQWVGWVRASFSF